MNVYMFVVKNYKYAMKKNLLELKLYRDFIFKCISIEKNLSSVNCMRQQHYLTENILINLYCTLKT